VPTPAVAAPDLPTVLMDTIVALVRRDGPDLSARQLGVVLICYLTDEEQTVRGLAAHMNISKPAITRALDRLGEFDLVRRKPDPADRRSVLVARTKSGATFMRELGNIVAKITRGEGAEQKPKKARRVAGE